MDISKVFAVICAFILIVCLVLCVTTLVVLRNAVDENEAVQCNANALVKELDQAIDRLILPETEPPKQDTEANATVATGYIAGVYQGKLAIYTSEGELLCCTPIDVSLLPASEQSALQIGIPIKDLSDLIGLMHDYTS